MRDSESTKCHLVIWALDIYGVLCLVSSARRQTLCRREQDPGSNLLERGLLLFHPIPPLYAFETLTVLRALPLQDAQIWVK